MIALGSLVAGHGVRGLARVHPFNPGSPALAGAREVWLAPRGGGASRRFDVLACRPHKRAFLLGLAGIDSLDALAPWIGSAVEVPAATLPELDGSEVYHHDVIGLEVRTADGTPIGTIAEVLAMPANDLWVVRGPAGADGRCAEHLVPAVAPIVTRIDLRERCAIIDPVPGLLDG